MWGAFLQLMSAAEYCTLPCRTNALCNQVYRAPPTRRCEGHIAKRAESGDEAQSMPRA